MKRIALIFFSVAFLAGCGTERHERARNCADDVHNGDLLCIVGARNVLNHEQAEFGRSLGLTVPMCADNPDPKLEFCEAKPDVTGVSQ